MQNPIALKMSKSRTYPCQASLTIRRGANQVQQGLFYPLKGIPSRGLRKIPPPGNVRGNMLIR